MIRSLICSLLALFATCIEIAAVEPSLHVLIATIGRSSIFDMLESLEPQLSEKDYLTIVFDAKDKDGVFLDVVEYVNTFRCTSSVIMEEKNLGWWGHAIRNKYKKLPGDFILHADDDDIYAEDAMEIIRKTCTDMSTLYIFKMQYKAGHSIWRTPQIIHCEIGTPMGVIPSRYNAICSWANAFAGDYNFYTDLEQIVPTIEFVDHIIYYVRP